MVVVVAVVVVVVVDETQAVVSQVKVATVSLVTGLTSRLLVNLAEIQGEEMTSVTT